MGEMIKKICIVTGEMHKRQGGEGDKVKL